MSNSIPRTIKKIDNYQLGEQIGKGAVGVVYRGINIDNATTVAIKQISIDNLKEEDKKSIKMEINLLKKLKHENIVKYIDVVPSENHLNIILEYVDAGSLSSIIKKFGSFPESLVAIYIKQLLTGLDYLHSQGVVHRDIKGANLLSTKEGLVKLADFGVATKLNEGEKAVSVVGTPYWMAPEIIEMRGHVSTSCDIWSVGCTVIELLTGAPPYYGLAQGGALKRIVQDDHPPLPNGISESCKDFLLRCFQKDPVLRIDAKGLLNHTWIIGSNYEALDIIARSNGHLPEEVTNSIRLHIDKTNPAPLSLPKISGYANDSSNDDDAGDYQLNNSSKLATILSRSPSHHAHHGPLYDNLRNESPKYTEHPARPKVYDEAAKEGMQPKGIFSKTNTGRGNNIPIKYQNMMTSNQNSNFLRQENRQNIMQFDPNKDQGQKQLGPHSHHYNNPYEEGSFVSVDNEGARSTIWDKVKSKRLNYEPRVNDICSRDDFHQVIRNLNEIIDNLLSIKDYTEASTRGDLGDSIMHIVDILKAFPMTKQHFMKEYGLTGLIQILEQSDMPNVIHPTLQLINQIIEDDQNFQEQSCIFGILPYMIKYTQAEHPREVRVEAAYYLGQLAYSGCTTTLRIFIASGGFKALVELLDLNYEENKDLICVAIDSLFIIFGTKILEVPHLCRILFKLGIFQRLVLLIGNLYTDRDENTYEHLIKALNLMVNFAKCEDSNIRQLMCEDGILLVLQIYLRKFAPKPSILGEVVKIIRYISSEPSILNKLEIIGILPMILDLIRKSISHAGQINESEDLLIDLTNILFHMCKLNAKRQEQIALNGGIPLLIHLTRNTTKEIELITFPLLCHLVQTSDITRGKLWENGGPKILLNYLDDEYYQPKILNAIAFWLNIDQVEVESFLTEHHVFNKLLSVFRNANKTNFEQIAPIYLSLIQLSNRLGVKLSKTPEFLQEIVERLGMDTVAAPVEIGNSSKESTGRHKLSASLPKKPVRIECCDPSALVRKELLDILIHLCLRHSNPRSLLNEHNLHSIIMQILHDEDMVILEGKAAQLWQIYSGNPNVPKKY